MPATKPPRTTGWTIAPSDTPAGRLAFLHLSMNGKTDHYRVRWLDADDMSVVLEVAKEQPDGSFADPYRVVLPTPGGFGRPVCSCPGWRRYGKCRHGDSLTALLARDLG